MEPTIYKPSIYKGVGIYKTGAEGGGGDVNILYYSFFDNTNVITGETTPIVGDTQNLFDYGTGFTLSKSNYSFVDYPVQKNVLTVTSNDPGNVSKNCRLVFNDNKSLCIKLKADIYAPDSPEASSFLWLINNLTSVLSFTKSGLYSIHVLTRGTPQYFNGAYFDHDTSPYTDSIIPNTGSNIFREFKIIVDKKTNKVYLYIDNVVYLSFDYVFSNRTEIRLDPRNLGYIKITDILVFESDLIENEL